MSIEINNLSHHFGEQAALKQVSLSIKQGELVALLGPSGCGKTTLLRLIAGLERVQQGEIELEGQQVASSQSQLAPEHRGIGMMFQDYALFPHMSVLKNIEYGLRDQQDKTVRGKWIQEMLQVTGLSTLQQRFPHTLSGGQQQRVALLRALAPEPKTMLLDEPFSALDEHLRQQVREETLDVLKSSGASAVMVTHDPLEAMFIADKIVVMDQGEIVQVGEPKEIYQSPANAFVAALFGPANRFDASVSSGALATPLGKISTLQLKEAQDCEVIIRAKDVRVHQLEGEGLVEAEVVSVHAMGHETHFRLRSNFAPERILHARMKDHWQAERGAKVWLEVDDKAAFVFPQA